MLLKEARLAEKGIVKTQGSKSGVLVVGVDSLLTQLAKCCKPAPPDAIGGFVTRGKGVSIHRADCPNLRQLLAKDAGRVIEVAWGQPKAGATGGLPTYAVDVTVQASDRTGLLRDIAEVFSQRKSPCAKRAVPVHPRHRVDDFDGRSSRCQPFGQSTGGGGAGGGGAVGAAALTQCP